jgi:hypothetical protein
MLRSGAGIALTEPLRFVWALQPQSEAAQSSHAAMRCMLNLIESSCEKPFDRWPPMDRRHPVKYHGSSVTAIDPLGRNRRALAGCRRRDYRKHRRVSNRTKDGRKRPRSRDEIGRGRYHSITTSG